MGNIVAGIVLLGIIAWAVRASVKHFRGESGCCGGGSAPAAPQRKQLAGKPLRTYCFSVDGMHCQNCANAVERAINGIEGAAATVDLRKNEAKVRCDREIDIAAIKAAVKASGYGITELP